MDAVFSKTRKRGGKDVTTWGDLGLTGDWASRPISHLRPQLGLAAPTASSRSTCSQTGDYKDTVKEQPGSASVVQGVTEDRFGIGYSGIGYKTSGVKAAPARREGASSSTGRYANVTSGKYPLSRFLYIYVNKAPGKPLDPLVKEFLKLILSKDGQEVVVKDGYLPLIAGARRRGAEEARVDRGRALGVGSGGSPAPGARPRDTPRRGHPAPWPRPASAFANGWRPRPGGSPASSCVDRDGHRRHHLRRRLHHPERPRSSSCSSFAEALPLFRGARAERLGDARARGARRAGVTRRRSRSASTSTSVTSTT